MLSMADDDQSLGHIELSMDDVIKVFSEKCPISLTVKLQQRAFPIGM